MRLLLIRHGETEHNVAGLLAGVTDSRLTNHGVIQAQKLGSHLIRQRQIRFSQVFASDLQRASRTAKEICEVQNAVTGEQPNVEPIRLALLRERDFGSFELLPWNRSQDARQNDPSSNDPDFKPKETADAMKARADTFLDDCLLPLLALDEACEYSVAVVSHGLFLAALWRALLKRFEPSTVSISPEMFAPGSNRPLEYLPSWTNTGILELDIKEFIGGKAKHTTSPSQALESTVSSPKLDALLRVLAVNDKQHLANLKRTRGGLGSSASDDKQKRLDNFFKKPRVEKMEAQDAL